MLLDVRNYPSLDFRPQGGLSLFVGANAQGKSNLLESIALLGTGRSFRTTRDRELVRFGCDGAVVSGTARTRGGTVTLACSVARTTNGFRKRYTINGTPVRHAGYLGRARVVTFVPRDLDLITGPPARRRTLLNAALSQESPAYYAALSRYTAHLEQKRALLRVGGHVDATLLETYDERLAAAGAELVVSRDAFVQGLAERAARAYSAWSADGTLEVAYAPDVAAARDRAGTEEALAERFRAVAAAEMARRTALVGPHRDDIAVSLDGRPLAAFGSQGQQRSAVLAIKLAEYELAAEAAGETPLLLLDDVLSELDAARQSALLEAIRGAEQAFVSATWRPRSLGDAATYRVNAGTLERVA